MKVLLSIKPEFAEKIFEGSKKYEFRRTIFKNKQVRTVVVYSTSPVQMVVGEFEIDSILHANIQELWEETQEFSGLTKEYFFEYFQNKIQGYAIKIKNPQRYTPTLSLRHHFKLYPPQSFVYLH